MSSTILTPRLRLEPVTPDLLRAELAGRAAFAAAIQVAVPPSWPPELYDEDAIRHTLAALEGGVTWPPWVPYYAILRDTPGTSPTLAGTVAFKRPPDGAGSVEIGYSVVTEYQRRGLATEAVRGLVDFAFGAPTVQVIVAQTLPDLTASRAVLHRLGFDFVGRGDDPDVPEDVEVIRYELRRGPGTRGAGVRAT